MVTITRLSATQLEVNRNGRLSTMSDKRGYSDKRIKLIQSNANFQEGLENSVRQACALTERRDGHAMSGGKGWSMFVEVTLTNKSSGKRYKVRSYLNGGTEETLQMFLNEMSGDYTYNISSRLD